MFVQVRYWLSTRILPTMHAAPIMAVMSSTTPREPHLLRFGLRQMFLFVTLVCVLLTLLVLTKGPWPLVIGATSALVAAHVFGTLIGNRLRDTSREVVEWRAANPALEDDVPQVNLRPSEAAKLAMPTTTHLAEHGHVCQWLLWFVLGGAVLGTVFGGTILGFTIGPRIGWAGWTIGAISCGVLGSWVAFLASSFYSIARHAWRDAHEKGS